MSLNSTKTKKIKFGMYRNIFENYYFLDGSSLERFNMKKELVPINLSFNFGLPVRGIYSRAAPLFGLVTRLDIGLVPIQLW